MAGDTRLEKQADLLNAGGITQLGRLSAESPLLPLFMVSKLEPDVVSDADMKDLTRAYYQTMFNYAIPDRLLNEVLSQR